MVSKSHLLAQLEASLQKNDWPAVSKALRELPTALPVEKSKENIASALELARSTADTLAESCDFSLSFERTFATRAGLLTTRAIEHATALLTTFAFEHRITDRIAHFFASLATTNAARNMLGERHVLQKLTSTWSRRAHSVPLLRALVALTSAHVDNISIVIRMGGMTTAIKTLTDTQWSPSTHDVLEHTVRLIAMCAIATPTENTQDKHSLIPTLTHTLRKASEDDCTAIANHTLMALANIGDCHIKEHEGYSIEPFEDMVDAILSTWRAHAGDSDIAMSASWALVALSKADEYVCDYVRDHIGGMASIMNVWTHQYRTTSFLHELTKPVIDEKTPGKPLAAPETKLTKRPTCHNPRRFSRTIPVALPNVDSTSVDDVTVEFSESPVKASDNLENSRTCEPTTPSDARTLRRSSRNTNRASADIPESNESPKNTTPSSRRPTRRSLLSSYASPSKMDRAYDDDVKMDFPAKETKFANDTNEGKRSNRSLKTATPFASHTPRRSSRHPRHTKRATADSDEKTQSFEATECENEMPRSMRRSLRNRAQPGLEEDVENEQETDLPPQRAKNRCIEKQASFHPPEVRSTEAVEVMDDVEVDECIKTLSVRRSVRKMKREDSCEVRMANVQNSLRPDRKRRQSRIAEDEQNVPEIDDVPQQRAKRRCTEKQMSSRRVTAAPSVAVINLLDDSEEEYFKTRGTSRIKSKYLDVSMEDSSEVTTEQEAVTPSFIVQQDFQRHLPRKSARRMTADARLEDPTKDMRASNAHVYNNKCYPVKRMRRSTGHKQRSTPQFDLDDENTRLSVEEDVDDFMETSIALCLDMRSVFNFPKTRKSGLENY